MATLQRAAGWLSRRGPALAFPTHLLRQAKRWVAREWDVHRALARHPSAQIGRGAEIVSPDRLELGEGVVIQNNAVVACGGQSWCNYGGGVSIGDHSGIGDGCLLWGWGGIVIGRCVHLGPGTMVFSSGENYGVEHARKPRTTNWFREVVIEDYVGIGARVTVLPGVRVGEGAVVGVGAVVTKDVPPWSIVAGVPARVIGERKDYRPRG